MLVQDAERAVAATRVVVVVVVGVSAPHPRAVAPPRPPGTRDTTTGRATTTRTLGTTGEAHHQAAKSVVKKK